MTSIVARLMLALALMLSVPMVYFIAFLIIENAIFSDDELALLVSNFLTAGYMIIAWTVIWLGEVKWTGLRLGLTIGSVFVCMLPGAVIGVIIVSVERHADEVAILFGGMAWAVTWLAATALIWRETRGERMTRLRTLGVNAIACPTCGYNMTGLQSTVCPECGSRYTVDQLYASQQGRGGNL